MTRLKKITIVTVSDNHYLILLAALIKSIEANLDKDTMLNMWVVDDGLTKANITKLEHSIDAGITNLQWRKVKNVIPTGIKLPLDYSSWPLNIYIRLFIPDFIPHTIEKVLFMDVDIINCKDLTELWQTDLGDNIVAAVQDSRIKTFDNYWGGILNYKTLGLPGDTMYFNSGVLLIDIGKWRSNNITQKTLDCIHNNSRFAMYPDQYGLNIVLMNKWLALNPEWNHFAGQDDTSANNIHFIERKPIYKTYNGSPAFRELFYHYLNLTEWKNTKPMGESKRYVKKLRNVFEKIRKRFS